MDIFDTERKRLHALAYRILGSASEAEDAVQEVYIKWHRADRQAIKSPPAWLTTCCTRQCIDMLQNAQRSRTDYVGMWLPEPLHLADTQSPEYLVELSSTVSTAFLLMLERLTPRERAAYLLREVLDLDYADVATALEVSEVACRQLVSRAKSRIGGSSRFAPPPRERQLALLAEFKHALRTGQFDQLVVLLEEDIELCADGGGKVETVLKPAYGRVAVLDLLQVLHRYWVENAWQPVTLSGALGYLLVRNSSIEAALTFAYDTQGLLSGIYVMRNPDKLNHLQTLASNSHE